MRLSGSSVLIGTHKMLSRTHICRLDGRRGVTVQWRAVLEETRARAPAMKEKATL
jgi:hypothetical protein